MKKLPHYYTRLCLVYSSIMLCLMDFVYRLFVLKEPLAAALMRLGIPLLFCWILYRVEYRYRILEYICLILKKAHIFYVLLPLCIGGFAAVFHHQSFLNWFLPLGFLFSQWAAEKEEHATFDSRLTSLLVASILFLELSLKLTYYSAAALTVAAISIVLLMRLMVYDTQEEWDFWKASSGLSILILWIGVLSPKILERMLYIAVSDEDYHVTGACMELFATARLWGQAEMVLSNFDDLLPYAPGYLVARYGWLSLVPLMAVIGVFWVSGFILCFRGLRRHTSTLAEGSYILLFVQILSWLLKSASVIIGFEGSFTEVVLNMLLLILVIQPINPKHLSQLCPSDPDFDYQEVCALILLPHNREGANILSQYVLDTPNYVGWTVLVKEFWNFFDDEERKALLLNSADVFGTHEELKKIHPEYYSSEEELLCLTTPNS